MTGQQPILLRSAFTGRIYISTSYRERGDGHIVALTRYDVTDQFEAIQAEHNNQDRDTTEENP